jgi:hypothetical protein
MFSVVSPHTHNVIAEQRKLGTGSLLSSIKKREQERENEIKE